MKRFLQLDLSNLRGDLFGGLTAGVVALPLALAFGEQTELGATAGLYGAIALGLVAALFGGTPTQISGPTAPMTVVSALVIADAIQYGGGLDKGLPIIVATFFLAGLLEALLGVFKLGKYIKYIPYPVISGFMSGIGVIIIITQIFPFLGVNAPEGGPLGTIRAVHKIPEIINFTSIGVALATIGIIYLVPRLSRKIPGTLVALVFISLSVYFFIPEDTLLLIQSRGEIPAGLPAVHLDFWGVFANLDHLSIIFEYALTLSALGAIDSLLTSVVADNISKTKHDSDQELIGQGLGNMAAAFIGGLPGAGATMRTVINANSGGKTKLSGVVGALFLLIVLLGLGGVVGHIPNAVLAGILITVGIGIIDYRGLKHLFHVPASEGFVMISVFLLTIFVDLLVAVAFGLVMASLLFMKKISEIVEERATQDSAGFRESGEALFGKEQLENLTEEEKALLERFQDKVYIKHLGGALFFGFAQRFQEMIANLKDLEVLIIRMERVPYIDQTGLYALEDTLLDLRKRNIMVLITGLQGQLLDMCRSIRIIPDLIDEDCLIDNLDELKGWLASYFRNREI